MVTAGQPTSQRVLLVGWSVQDRLELRRLLVGLSDVEIVAHAPSAQALLMLARQSNATALLVDAGADLAWVWPLLPQLDAGIKLVLMAGAGCVVPTALADRVLVLTRPQQMSGLAVSDDLTQSLRRSLAAAGPSAAGSSGPARSPQAAAQNVQAAPATRAATQAEPRIIAIGASTGGPQALACLLGGLAGRVRVPIVITQHLSVGFTGHLADQLSQLSAVKTLEAEDGMPVHDGGVYLARGGHHLVLQRQRDQVVIRLGDGPPENFCKPAVDPMLRSVVNIYGGNALAVILTGMGKDGLEGCRSLAAAGGVILAQDEATSVVWGMPGAVAQAKLCAAVLPLLGLAGAVLARFRSAS